MVPPVEVIVEEHDAARRHASDDAPEQSEQGKSEFNLANETNS